MRIDTKYHFEIVDELKALKNNVKEFLKEIQHVPFRAIDCDQQVVHNLRNKLIESTGYTDDH